MNQTFPIKCTACEEILDVAADIDVAAAYNCPMCGAGISIRDAEEFELDCPDEVVIEEQTSQRLRFRLPRSHRFFHENVLIWITCGASVISFVLGLYFLFEVYLRSRLLIELSMSIFLLANPVMATLYAIYFLKGTVYADLSEDELLLGFQIGIFSFGRRFNTLRIGSVFMKNHLFTLDPKVKSCMKLTARSINIASDQTRDTARYITHLLRRQLKTMGHDLNNGRS